LSWSAWCRRKTKKNSLMLSGDWGLLILDVIGGSALAAALIIALWRLAFRQAQDENGSRP
jgi:hypothetical protein